MKTLKILVVSAGSQVRMATYNLMNIMGHHVYGARTVNQAEAFIEENGSLLDAVIVDFDTVQIDIEQCLRWAPNTCLILQSKGYSEMSMPPQPVGSLLVSNKIETAEIEQYLQKIARQGMELVA